MGYPKLSLIHRRSGVYTFAALTLLIGVFFLRQDLLGKASAPPAVSEETTTRAAPASTETRPSPELPDSAIEAALRDPKAVTPIPPEYIDTETLWLARVIYSESKRPEEQELVAWVVRNRVETAYRDKGTYQDVALDPYQFSAFNPDSRKLHYYSKLDVDSQARGWKKTLALAYYVRHAAPALRPFPVKTRHFYSEQSLPKHIDHPEWTKGLEPVTPRRPVLLDAQRFRFYAGVI